MICCFCGRFEEEKDAVGDGWIPAFWAQDKEWEGPVCGTCTTEHHVTPDLQVVNPALERANGVLYFGLRAKIDF
jgi:hypothetical protein